jgi:Family of unknown function (DUF6221)
MTLTEFLTARLDEDEAAHREIHEARVCSGCSDGWEAGFDPDRCDCGYPARVLREVEAKRKILADYECQSGFSLPEGVHDGRDPDERECDQALKDALEIVICDLAAIWSDHPDYQQEWKP